MSRFRRIPDISDEEEARIQQGIAQDPDNPELTDEELANMKPFHEVFPHLAKSMQDEIRKRGRPRVENAKQAVTLRVTPDTLARFKAAGKDWRTRMSEALDKAKP